jgi:hypothetical protein
MKRAAIIASALIALGALAYTASLQSAGPSHDKRAPGATTESEIEPLKK